MNFQNTKFSEKVMTAIQQRLEQAVRHHKTALVKEDAPTTITVKITLRSNAEADTFAHKLSTNIALAPHPDVEGVIFAIMDGNEGVAFGEYRTQQMELPVA